MMEEPEWVNVHVGFEDDDFSIDGVSVWAHPWKSIDEHVMLANRPDDSTLSRFHIYEIETAERVIRFAGSEILPNVHSFYSFMVKPDRFKDLKRSVAIAEYISRKNNKS